MVVLEHPRLGESIEEAFTDYETDYSKIFMIITVVFILYVILKDVYSNYMVDIPLKDMKLKIISIIILSVLSIYSIKSLFLD